jgi:uncharacterized protein involved in exopolysaccharide biosynthesis
MNNVVPNILRFFYKIRYWVICGSLLALFVAILATKNMRKEYEVNASIYTGFVAGFSIGDMSNSENNRVVDAQQVNNSVDNLIGILTARYTLKKVSMRLFIQDMTYGNPYKDNNYITAANFRYVYSQTPQEVRDLIDKSSEEVSMQRLLAYEKSTPDNYVYGLFNWNHPLYGYNALSKIKVERIGTSDIMEMTYSSNDPGIAYNTILFIYDEFVKEYKTLRFGEVDDVIAYFMRELEIAKNNLTSSEDALTRYNVANRIVNYDKQTEDLTGLDKEHQINYEQLLRDYYSSIAELEVLDKNMKGFTQSMKNNTDFLNRITDLVQKSKSVAYVSMGDVKDGKIDVNKLQRANDEYRVSENNLLELKKDLKLKEYTKEGVAAPDFINSWFDAEIKHARNEAELKVMEDRSKFIDKIYVHFSPIGTTLKRKEREIKFEENIYLNDLVGLNNAKLRRKSLQVSSSSLKILNPPDFPISPMPSKRKMIVLLSFILSVIFIIAVALILEFLDKSLRDKFIAERITGCSVLGALAEKSKVKYKIYNKKTEELSVQYIANSIFNNISASKEPGPVYINIYSSYVGEGKHYLMSNLVSYWEMVGLKVKCFVANTDFVPDSREYLFADMHNFSQLTSGFDVIIIVHPELMHSPISENFLSISRLNLFLVRSTRTWSDSDRILLDGLRKKSNVAKTMLVITHTQREAVEMFTGMLPPNTFLRRLKFKFLQIGGTA